MRHEMSLVEDVEKGRAELRLRVTPVVRDRRDLLMRLDAGARAMRHIDRINALVQEIDEVKHASIQLELFEVLT